MEVGQPSVQLESPWLPPPCRRERIGNAISIGNTISRRV